MSGRERGPLIKKKKIRSLPIPSNQPTNLSWGNIVLDPKFIHGNKEDHYVKKDDQKKRKGQK